jgi:hypothetical protein
MGQSSIPEQQYFNGGEVFIIHGLLLSMLITAFVLGMYAAAKKWPSTESHKSMAVDLLVSLPFAMFIIWMVIPRIGLAGDTILESYTLGNPALLTTCFLSFALLNDFWHVVSLRATEVEGDINLHRFAISGAA